jgi:hypothetical protein
MVSPYGSISELSKKQKGFIVKQGNSGLSYIRPERLGL